MGRASREALKSRWPCGSGTTFVSLAGEEHRAEVAGFVRVDADGDGALDTYLPGTSNFFAGVLSTQGKPGTPDGLEKSKTCHLSDGCQHCIISTCEYCPEP